jgi:hypothetical protein
MIFIHRHAEFPACALGNLAADLDLARETDDAASDTSLDEVVQELMDAVGAVWIRGGDGGEEGEGLEGGRGG